MVPVKVLFRASRNPLGFLITVQWILPPGIFTHLLRDKPEAARVSCCCHGYVVSGNDSSGKLLKIIAAAVALC